MFKLTLTALLLLGLMVAFIGLLFIIDEISKEISKRKFGGYDD